MKVALLFSGGKDSTYAGYLAQKQGHEIACLVSIFSENKESYMFHTPSVSKVEKQAEVMDIPITIQKTKGKKEEELKDLKIIIEKVKKDYGVEGIVTGAIKSVYQSSRIQDICNDLNLECINPLWEKDEVEFLEEIVKENFEIIIVGVFAYPLDEKWLGRKIDKDFIKDAKKLEEKYRIHPAGEGGEFETFVLNCPLFKRELKVKNFKDINEGEHSWRREIEVE